MKRYPTMGVRPAMGPQVASGMEWIVSIEDNGQIHHLSLRQAIQQGYTFFSDDSDIIIQQDDHVLYTVAIKLTYGPPEQRLTLESRMICAPGPAVCNSTHMMVILPAFPGKLTAVHLNEKNILVHQLQANGIGVDTRKGAYRDHDCSGIQLYIASLTLNFDYHGEIATMVSYPECPCEQNAPIDGHMDFEIASSSTKPDLNLGTLRLRDPTCGPVPWSASKDRVHFHQSYSAPYTDDQYPLVKYLRQPIFLEVQVLNRNDPNIHLMLDDCWATLSLEPSCEYELDNYKTIFHPVGPAVSYANFRQRFEVKAFAFVSDGKALSNHVYFHCSVIICDKQRPDSLLCSSGCPRSSRKRREEAMEKTTVVTLPHAVILLPEEQFKMQGVEHQGVDCRFFDNRVCPFDCRGCGPGFVIPKAERIWLDQLNKKIPDYQDLCALDNLVDHQLLLSTPVFSHSSREFLLGRQYGYLGDLFDVERSPTQEEGQADGNGDACHPFDPELGASLPGQGFRRSGHLQEDSLVGHCDDRKGDGESKEELVEGIPVDVPLRIRQAYPTPQELSWQGNELGVHPDWSDAEKGEGPEHTDGHDGQRRFPEAGGGERIDGSQVTVNGHGGEDVSAGELAVGIQGGNDGAHGPSEFPASLAQQLMDEERHPQKEQEVHQGKVDNEDIGYGAAGAGFLQDGTDHQAVANNAHQTDDTEEGGHDDG
ncbi:hypothetical protein E2320_012131 [Naja naja]|nr:hypothetical protein E2320_012131 [Naja naja]